MHDVPRILNCQQWPRCAATGTGRTGLTRNCSRTPKTKRSDSTRTLQPTLKLLLQNAGVAVLCVDLPHIQSLKATVGATECSRPYTLERRQRTRYTCIRWFVQATTLRAACCSKGGRACTQCAAHDHCGGESCSGWPFGLSGARLGAYAANTNCFGQQTGKPDWWTTQML